MLVGSEVGGCILRLMTRCLVEEGKGSLEDLGGELLLGRGMILLGRVMAFPGVGWEGFLEGEGGGLVVVVWVGRLVEGISYE